MRPSFYGTKFWIKLDSLTARWILIWSKLGRVKMLPSWILMVRHIRRSQIAAKEIYFLNLWTLLRSGRCKESHCILLFDFKRKKHHKRKYGWLFFFFMLTCYLPKGIIKMCPSFSFILYRFLFLLSATKAPLCLFFLFF